IRSTWQPPNSDSPAGAHLAPGRLHRFSAPMAKEVERKFLLSGDGWRRHVASSRSLVQFYLFSLPGRTVRVRIADDVQAWVTMKFGDPALTRDEFEYEIPLADAFALRSLASGNVIEKTRHVVPFGDLSFEVDLFAGA